MISPRRGRSSTRPSCAPRWRGRARRGTKRSVRRRGTQEAARPPGHARHPHVGRGARRAHLARVDGGQGSTFHVGCLAVGRPKAPTAPAPDAPHRSDTDEASGVGWARGRGRGRREEPAGRSKRCALPRGGPGAARRATCSSSAAKRSSSLTASRDSHPRARRGCCRSAGRCCGQLCRFARACRSPGVEVVSPPSLSLDEFSPALQALETAGACLPGSLHPVRFVAWRAWRDPTSR
jgi:hypothetical protein